MDIPAIPTDNIYKFFAIGGFGVMIFSLTYLPGKALDLHLALVDTEAQISKHKLEFDRIKDVLEIIEEKSATTRTSEEIAAVKASVMAYDNTKIDIQASLKRQELQLRWMWAYLLAATIGALSGGFAMVRGFRLWYYRIQLPQDRNARADSK